MSPSHTQHLFYISNILSLAAAQITGTYPALPTNAPNPDGGLGTNLSNYPQCAQECGNTYAPVAHCPVPPATPDLTCDCGPVNRGIVSPCEAQTCDDVDFLKSQQLSQDLCSPVYAANASLSSLASAAIASATSIALGPQVVGKDVGDISVFPACTQSCLPAALTASGCLGQDDRECVCHCVLFVDSLAPCEFSSCSSEELSLISYLSNNLCLPVGGQLPKNLSACRANTASASGTGLIGNGTPAVPTGAINPSITPFTGVGLTVEPGLTMVALGGGLALLLSVVG